jgi:hypothetical protein
MDSFEKSDSSAPPSINPLDTYKTRQPVGLSKHLVIERWPRSDPATRDFPYNLSVEPNFSPVTDVILIVFGPTINRKSIRNGHFLNP